MTAAPAGAAPEPPHPEPDPGSGASAATGAEAASDLQRKASLISSCNAIIGLCCCKQYAAAIQPNARSRESCFGGLSYCRTVSVGVCTCHKCHGSADTTASH
jgi:hypothetical protein